MEYTEDDLQRIEENVRELSCIIQDLINENRKLKKERCLNSGLDPSFVKMLKELIAFAESSGHTMDDFNWSPFIDKLKVAVGYKEE